MKLDAGARLPAGLQLRSGRGPQVLVAVHSCTCAGCLALLERIGGVADRVLEWGGRLVVVVPGSERDDSDAFDACRAAAGADVRVMSDPDGRIASGAAARIVIADEWGEVYFSAASEDDHAVVTPREILDWVRFIVIQCPECEGPEGEWRTLREA